MWLDDMFSLKITNICLVESKNVTKNVYRQKRSYVLFMILWINVDRNYIVVFNQCTNLKVGS